VIEFRCFRNDDPPRLADAWRSADLGPSAMQPMTSALLESSVFSKPYFDRDGLIVARDPAADRVVGFAHAAFGPNADQTAVDTRVGTTLLAVVLPHAEREAIGAGLISRCESYLRGRGATTLLGGGSAEMRSFYLGLYGGSDLPGILDSSPEMQHIFTRAGYVEADRIAVLRRPLSGFRPPVNRLQMAIRRATTLRAIDEPTRRTWWEAATTTGIALRRYELRSPGNELLGSASYWDMQPLAMSWGVSMAGLLHVGIEGPRRRQGLAHYLVAESMHDLASEGVAVVETHVSDTNLPAMQLFGKLGFESREHGTRYRLPADRPA
jgi:GNAT superfamily N-acetyltransferase/ribosomal protein S18 acetylase RimI-like enzyme